MPRFPRLRRERPINAANPVPAPKEAMEAEEAPAADAKAAEIPATEDSKAPAPGPEPKAEQLPVSAGPTSAAKRREAAAKVRESPTKPEAKKPKAKKPKAKKPKAPKPKTPRKPITLTPRAKLGVATLAGAAIAVGVLAAAGALSSDDTGSGDAPAPVISSPSRGSSGSQAATDLGFPAFATRNTTRVGGADAVSNAAGIALATFPSTGGARSPIAVSLVAEDDWQTGVAASSLVAPPLGIPVLLSSSGGIPDATQQALTALTPRGGALSGGTQAFTFGEATAPDNLRERPVIGDDPAALAADIDRLRTELTGEEPGAIVVTTSESPEFAMPAAAYAARSGDPVLFTGPKKLPAATARALGNHKGVPVYVLGPPSVIPDRVLGEITEAAGAPAKRIAGEDPVSNAIAYAKYSDGAFGWDIADPGHGFVVARSDRPMDAAAASALSASGTWGALLLTDNTETLPGALRGYLLDVEPGYTDDPTRALYNRVWIIGDEEAISVDQQAAIDELAELKQIGQPAIGQPGAGGATGATGAKGTKGAAGATGATGASGKAGASGKVGASGATGAAGQAGGGP